MAEILHALRYPFAIDAGGGRAAEESDYDTYVRQLIRQVLLTAPGERINRPDFGAGVRRMVFAPNSPATATLARTFVYQALTRWLATVIKVEEVKVSAVESTMLIDVRYIVIQRGETRILREEVAF
jgi:phage baseplate assembly protein W